MERGREDPASRGEAVVPGGRNSCVATDGIAVQNSEKVDAGTRVIGLSRFPAALCCVLCCVLCSGAERAKWETARVLL